jgi:hypothetical protein
VNSSAESEEGFVQYRRGVGDFATIGLQADIDSVEAAHLNRELLSVVDQGLLARPQIRFAGSEPHRDGVRRGFEQNRDPAVSRDRIVNRGQLVACLRRRRDQEETPACRSLQAYHRGKLREPSLAVQPRRSPAQLLGLKRAEPNTLNLQQGRSTLKHRGLAGPWRTRDDDCRRTHFAIVAHRAEIRQDSP